jgi:hypothetical protein
MNQKLKLSLGHWAVFLAFLVVSKDNALGSPIPIDFDKNTVQFIFTRVSETNYVPLGTCFGVQVTTIHRPKFWGHVVRYLTALVPFLPARISRPDITYYQRYFVTAKHVLFDEKGNLRSNMYMRFPRETGGVTLGYLTRVVSLRNSFFPGGKGISREGVQSACSLRLQLIRKGSP